MESFLSCTISGASIKVVPKTRLTSVVEGISVVVVPKILHERLVLIKINNLFNG